VTIEVLPSGDCLALEDSHFGYTIVVCELIGPPLST
jgi:hypothetical protein